MALIIGKDDIRAVFEKAWIITYVPALLLFGKRSKKKHIKDIFSQCIETGKIVKYIYTINEHFNNLQMMLLDKKLHYIY